MSDTPTHPLPEGHVVIGGVEFVLEHAWEDHEYNHDADVRYVRTIQDAVTGRALLYLADGREYTVDENKRVVRPEKPLWILRKVEAE